jgi:Peptidase family M28
VSGPGRPRIGIARALLIALVIGLVAIGGLCAIKGWRRPEPNKIQVSAADSSVAEPSATATIAAQRPSPIPRPTFSAQRALRDVRALQRSGVRSEGSAAEKRGAAYIVSQLRAMHVRWHVSPFRLPNGLMSHNVIARLPGAGPKTVILGAHMDSKAPSPGANDNGTGCGVLLELARCLAKRPAEASVKVVFFGSEEMIDANQDHHHFGSRTYVKQMSASARRNTVGMISVDMVGYGQSFVVRSMGTGPQTMVHLLLKRARARGMSLSYLRDEGTYGWSDHEPFERAGFASAWIEWSDDPVYHTVADTADHIAPSKVRLAGSLLLGFLYHLGPKDLRKLGG